MKTIKTTLMALALAAAVSAPAFAAPAPAAVAAAPAAAPAAFTFGVIDMSKVLNASDAAKDIYAQLNDKSKQYQSEISKEEDALRGIQASLMKDKDKISKEEMDKKRTEFETRFAAWQKMGMERKRTLDAALANAMNKLRGESVKIVAGIAKDKNYSAVLTQDAVMISRPDLDMTDVVVAELNKSLKKLPIDWSAASAAAAPAAEKKK